MRPAHQQIRDLVKDKREAYEKRRLETETRDQERVTGQLEFDEFS
jgi:hypothetical protein